jgi:hypothetical protein
MLATPLTAPPKVVVPEVFTISAKAPPKVELIAMFPLPLLSSVVAASSVPAPPIVIPPVVDMFLKLVVPEVDKLLSRSVAPMTPPNVVVVAVTVRDLVVEAAELIVPVLAVKVTVVPVKVVFAPNKTGPL